jgi:SAM-dependent methyltransferase
MAYEKDSENSLELYNQFLLNVGEKKTIQKFVESIIKRKGKAVLLDVGCGNAGALAELKKTYGNKIEVCGIDAENVNSRESNSKTDVKSKIDVFVKGDFLEKELPQKNDLVFSFRALHEAGDIEKIVSKIEQSLAPLGKAVLLIRVRTENKALEGNMQEEDEDFIVKLAKKGKLGKSRAKVVAAFDENQEFITGVVLKLERQT